MKKSSTRSGSQDLEAESRRDVKRSRIVIEEGYWDCSFCTYRNKAEASKCDMCNIRKGTSTRKPRLTQVTQQFAKIESQIEQERKKEKRKEVQKTKPNKRSSNSSNSNSNFANAQTISITVKGLTVFITDYELSNCSSSNNTTNTKNLNGQVVSTHDANGSESDNDEHLSGAHKGDLMDELEGSTNDKITADYSDSKTEDSDSNYSEKQTKAVKTVNRKSTSRTNKRKLPANKAGDETIDSAKKSKKIKKSSSLNNSCDSDSSVESPVISSSSNKRKKNATKKAKTSVHSSSDSHTESSNNEELSNEESSSNEEPIDEKNKSNSKNKNVKRKSVPQASKSTNQKSKSNRKSNAKSSSRKISKTLVESEDDEQSKASVDNKETVTENPIVEAVQEPETKIAEEQTNLNNVESINNDETKPQALAEENPDIESVPADAALPNSPEKIEAVNN